MQVKSVRRRRAWFRTAERSIDPVYALAVLGMAERWAMYMEARLAAGEKIADMAEDTLREAVPGTSALDPHTQWGDVVVDYLSGCWQHGDQLRRWYGPSRGRKN